MDRATAAARPRRVPRPSGYVQRMLRPTLPHYEREGFHVAMYFLVMRDQIFACQWLLGLIILDARPLLAFDGPMLRNIKTALMHSQGFS